MGGKMNNKRWTTMVVRAARQASGRKVLSCAAAFRLARELKVPLRDIGRFCDQHQIRIVGCQLGCFS